MKIQFLPVLAGLLLATTASAQWTSPHRDASQNRYVPVTGFTTVDGTPAQSYGTDLGDDTSIIFDNSTVYAVVRTTSPASATVAAYDKATGAAKAGYTNPVLSPANPNFSVSAPVVDGGDVFFATDSRAYRIDGATGTIEWTTPFTSANTDPTANAQYDIVNGHAAVSPSRVFYHTNDSSFSAPFNKSQLVALNKGTGAVEWFVRCGGIGSNSPLYFDNGGLPIVITHVSQGTGGGMIAYNATAGTPTEVWNSATVSSPWGTTNLFWGDSILVAGKIYGVTYNFSATNGQLVKVDAATGALDWSVASITADCPPVLAGGTLYLVGGSFGSGVITRHNETTGALLGSSASPITGVFRNYLTVTDSYVYMASSGTGLVVLNRATLAEENRSAATGLSAPPSIDTNGVIYTKGTGAITAFDATSDVSDWSAFH